MQPISSVQIGKKGITENFFCTLQEHFKKHQNVKVAVLQSARHGSSKQAKKDVEKIAEKIIEKLGKKYTYRILGFTIFIKKWRKAVRP